MTTFYRFGSQDEFLSNDGRRDAEYIQDGIGVSVIGDCYTQPPELDPAVDPSDYADEFVAEYLGYLVNAAEPIDMWDRFRVSPAAQIRLFG